MENEKIEIRPEVTMLGVLRHLNYKPWFAIAEFVDNSLQSYLTHKDALQAVEGPDFHLKVTIDLSTAAGGEIVVTDNAAGISAADFPRAFRAAQVPADRSGLSEFGMGMRSRLCLCLGVFRRSNQAFRTDHEEALVTTRHVLKAEAKKPSMQ